MIHMLMILVNGEIKGNMVCSIFQSTSNWLTFNGILFPKEGKVMLAVYLLFIFSSLQMTLTSSGVSVDGYFQTLLLFCEIWNDSREPCCFDDNSNFLLAEVDGWHFCFVSEISDLTFYCSLTETFTVLWGRTYSLLDTQSLKTAKCSWCSDDSSRVRDGWECVCQYPQRMTTSFTAIYLVLWHFLLVEWQNSLIPCDCSLLRGRCFQSSFTFLRSTRLLGVVVNSGFGHRSFLPWKNSLKPFLQILSQWILESCLSCFHLSLISE